MRSRPARGPAAAMSARKSASATELFTVLSTPSIPTSGWAQRVMLAPLACVDEGALPFVTYI